MKKHSTIYRFLFLLGFLALMGPLWAADGFAYEKKKVITRNIPLQSGSKVVIKNSFGKVNVSHWNKNELQIVITILASANNEKLAQDILDAISVDEKTGNTLSFETKTNGKSGNNKSKGNRSMQINYEITLPQTTTLAITNSFGETVVPSRTGITTLAQTFGNLTTGYLTNLDKVYVEQGKLSSEGFENSKGDFKFSEIAIHKLAGDLTGNFEFCTSPKINLSTDVKDVNIKTSYSNMTIAFPIAFKANIDIHSKFGELENKSPIKLTRDNTVKDMFEKRYVILAPNSHIKIMVTNEFGKVTIK